MNYRIKFPSGGLERFSPNLEFLASVLELLAPEDLQGDFAFVTSASGLSICFSGSGALRGSAAESPIIPRWMFCEEAFRSLLVAKVESFLSSLEPSAPVESKAEPAQELLPGWLL